MTNKPILGIDISTWQTKENLPKPTTQVEEIVWYLIISEKPPKRDYYMLHFKHNGEIQIHESYYTGNNFYVFKNEQTIHIPFSEIIAWAYPPKGWKE